jgi:predicted enzyme related to lactoylglutathione lyase
MKVELGIEDWSSGEMVFVHESELPRSGHLARGLTTIEGSVRIVADDGTRLHIYDDLVALLAHLGGHAPMRILGEGQTRHAWLQVVQSGDLSITTDGSFLVVARNDPPPAPFAPPAWVGVELYVDTPDAAAFYRALLGPSFEGITVRTCVGRMSPQWVGLLGGSDPVALGARISNETGDELLADDSHHLWGDSREANFAWGSATGGVRVARRVLRTLHMPSSIEFYGAALGWNADGARLTREGVEMTVLEPAGDGCNEQWRHYLAVDDLDAAVARAIALGANELDRSPGAVWLADPHGGEFGLARCPDMKRSPRQRPSEDEIREDLQPERRDVSHRRQGGRPSPCLTHGQLEDSLTQGSVPSTPSSSPRASCSPWAGGSHASSNAPFAPTPTSRSPSI